MRLLLLFFLLCGAPAWACSCDSSPSAKDAWLESPLVFAGVVDKTDPKITSEQLTGGEQTAWVRVAEPFKGVKKDQVLELANQLGGCFGGFRDGSSILFYLLPSEKPGAYVAPACHRSRLMSVAADDLKFLRGLPTSAHGNRVSGIVELFGEGPGIPQAGVRVQAESSSLSHQAFTDAQGLYEFRDLPPGNYNLRIDYPKGTTLGHAIARGRSSSPQRYFVLGKKGRMQLEVTAESGNGFDFFLSYDTRIAGRVLDPDRRPMEGVCLEIEPLQRDPAIPEPSLDNECTGTGGSYAFEKVPPGRYRIVANRQGQMTAAAPVGRLYYPGTPELDKAGVVTVAAGQHLEGIDLHATELARRLELRGRLIFSNGVPLPGQSVGFHSKDASYHEYGRTDADGNFTMQILAGRAGQLVGEPIVWWSDDACPQFRAVFNPTDHAAGLPSVPYDVAGDRSISGIEVVFPVPSCDEWLRWQRGDPKPVQKP